MTCPLCGKEFEPPKENPWTCLVCREVYCSQACKERHMKGVEDAR